MKKEMKNEMKKSRIPVAVAVVAMAALVVIAGPARAALVGHWELDDAAGATAGDSAGSNQGTLTNMDPATDWVAGKIGGALDFDGIDDYVNVSPFAPNLNSNTVTITAWVNGRAAKGWAGFVLCRGGTTRTGLQYGNADELRYMWNSNHWNWVTGFTIPVDEWAFIAMVVTPTAATVYLGTESGGLNSTTNTATHDPEAFDGGLDIGRDGGGREYIGIIDDVRIYDEALSGAQINDLYLLGAAVEVSIVATDPIATEGATPQDLGQFTVTRTGGTVSDLVVNLDVYGDAVMGAAEDYTTDVPSVTMGACTVTIPAGDLSTEINVTPVDDADAVAERVIIEVTPGGYDYIDPANYKGVVTIADDDAPPGAFVLSAPADGEMGVEIAPLLELKWEASLGAMSYYLIVADNASLTAPLIDIQDDVTITTNSYILYPTDLDYGAAYWWKVTAHNAISDVEATVSPFQFTTAYGRPLITIVTTSGALEPSTPGVFTLRRSVGDPADPLTVYYAVNDILSTALVGVNFVALSGTVDFPVDVTAVTIAVMPMNDADAIDEDLVVAVTANAAYDLGSPASATMTIGDDDVEPRPFDLLNPTDTLTGVSLTATLEWETALGAADYVLLVDDNDPADGDWIEPEVTVTVTGTSYVVPAYYLSGLTIYSWKVTAMNRIGPTDASNAPFSFTTEADLTAPEITGTSPGDGDTRVRVSTDIKINFSEPMDSAFVTGMVTVTSLETGDVTGAESLSVNERSITFKPDADLLESITYTVTVSANVRDVAANQLDGDGNGTGGEATDDYTFTFTTEAPLAGLVEGPGCLPGAGSALGLAMLGAALALARRRVK